MRQNGRGTLLYAIVLGVLAAAGAGWYINRAEAAANPTQAVVVAKVSLPPRTVISEDVLTIKNFPAGAVHPESSVSMEGLVGKTTKQSIVMGEQILTSKVFSNRSETGLAFVLPEGRRAVAINVDERIAAGGLIVPGDRVDVLTSCVAPARDQAFVRDVAKVTMALQNVEVLAVAQEVAGEEAHSPLDTIKAQNPQDDLVLLRQPQTKPMARTITLALTPEEALTAVAYENHPACRVRLALRAPKDDRKAATTVVDLDPAVSFIPKVTP